MVDDDEAVRDSLGFLLSAQDLNVRTFKSADAFLANGDPASCHCLLLDMHMPGMTGLALLVELRRRGMNMPAIMITAGANSSLSKTAEEAGAFAVLRKPVPEAELIAWIDRAFAETAC